MRRLSTFASTGIVLVHSAVLYGQANRVDVVPREAERRVDVLVGGKPFTSYIYPASVKKPVLYPLHAANGLVVTRGFPLEPRPGERVDHPHHVGLWLNHSDVNGLDFWNNSDAIKPKDVPKMGTILHRGITAVKSGAGEGVLEVTSDWVKPDGKPLLREATRYVFHAGARLRGIDRITTLTALDTSVTFHDNKDGMLGLRVRRELEQPADKPEVFTDASGRATAVPVLNNDRVTGRYRSSEGLEGDSVWSSRARWTSLSGMVQGEPVAIVIFDHPTNYNFPTYWHARGYGLFAANPLGAKDFTKGQRVDDFTLAPGQSTTFRYRIVILNGEVAAMRERIEEQYTNWSR